MRAGRSEPEPAAAATPVTPVVAEEPEAWNEETWATTPAEVVVYDTPLSATMKFLSQELKKAELAANEAKTPIQMINAQEDINGLIDRMDKQEAIEQSAHERLLELMDAVLGDKGFPVSKEHFGVVKAALHFQNFLTLV